MIKNVFDWSEYDAVRRNLLYPQKRDFTTTYYYNKGQVVYVQNPNELEPYEVKWVLKESVLDEDDFKAAKEEYREKSEMLEKIFSTALFDYLGIISHPKRFKLYELVNEYSSDRSYKEIAEHAEDLAQLLV